MHVGKLYNFDDGQFVADISYQILGDKEANHWGELVPVEYVPIDGSEDYMLELDDNRRIKCNLKKRVNRAVSGIPPRYIYHFVGKPIYVSSVG